MSVCVFIFPRSIGENKHGQCNIPDLPQGMHYVQASASSTHTLLLRSDGHAVACGRNNRNHCSSQCTGKMDIPEDGQGTYVQVSAGENHSVFLCKNGRVLCCGYKAQTYAQQGTFCINQPAFPLATSHSWLIPVQAEKRYTEVQEEVQEEVHVSRGSRSALR